MEGQPGFDIEKDLKFEPVSSDSECLIEHPYMNFGTAVRKWAEAQNKTLAQCNVAYHTIEEGSSNIWIPKMKPSIPKMN